MRFPLLALLAVPVRATLRSSIPEDLFAFPKYRLAFLNALPLHNQTADRWLRDGLRGGEREFLDDWHPNAIAAAPPPPSGQPREPSPVLEHMRLGPSKSYLCLIPPPPTLPPPAHDDDDAHAPATPSRSWSLLQPLSGTCLYHRQAWFTYSYCHNLHVRQFRELPTTYPHPPGARVVEEDPEWESYTLGKSPSLDAELAVHDDHALLASNLELASQSAGQRYLVQRWSDGTVCDKTGRPREIEIQFHCSMTMTDTILFVKETRTCEYVLVIHTPRLCGEPGFKSRMEQMPESAIRCREVVDHLPTVDPALPDSPFPSYKRTPRPPVPSPQRPPEDEGKDPAAAAKDTVDRAYDTAKLLRKALESLLRQGTIDDMAMFEVQQGEQEGEFIFAIDTDRQEDDVPEDPAEPAKGATLEEALRAVGYNIKGRKMAKEEEEEREPPHDEL